MATNLRRTLHRAFLASLASTCALLAQDPQGGDPRSGDGAGGTAQDPVPRSRR
jgi:hypothetical protein